MKLESGYVAVRVGSNTRQYRDTNNAIVRLRQLDRASGHERPTRVEVHFPGSLGGGWVSGTPRFAIDALNRRIDRGVE